MVEDYDDDMVGEITFIDSVNGDYNTRWDSTNPPRYVTNNPLGLPFGDYQRELGAVDSSLVNPVPDPLSVPYLGIPQFVSGPAIGYRLHGDGGDAAPYSDGIYVDMYLDLALLGSPETLRFTWATDQEDTNLAQAPCCDRPDEGFQTIDLTGSITIEKDVPAGSSQDFEFTITPDGTVFSLDDDDDPALANSRTFTSLEPGSYTIAEGALAGWSLAQLYCSNETANISNFTTDLATGSVAVDLEPGSNVRCRFVNVADAPPGNFTLTVVKQASPANGDIFNFSLDATSFTLNDPGEPSRVFLRDPSATHTLTETVPAGWVAELSCSDPDIAISGATATIAAGDVADGDNVTCTYVNTQEATVRIVKEAEESASGSFDFTTNLGAGFTLQDAGVETFTNIAPGVYTVTESAPQGYFLTAIACVDASGVSSFTSDLDAGSVALTVAPGADLTCTFTNVETGNLIIALDSIPDDPGQQFDFEVGLGNFALSDDGSPVGECGNATTQCFDDVTPRNYPTRAFAPAGWNFVDISCDDPSAVVDVAAGTADASVYPGATTTCIFVARQRTAAAPVPVMDNLRLLLLGLIMALLALFTIRRRLAV